MNEADWIKRMEAAATRAGAVMKVKKVVAVRQVKKQPPNKIGLSDCLARMVANVRESIAGYVAAGFSPQDAKTRVKADSCAGPKVWEIIAQDE